MQIITSKDNETIKQIKKLKEKKYRDMQNCYIIEGIKLVCEAILENMNIKKIVICEDCLKNNSIDKKMLYDIARFDCIYVSENVFKTITDVATPQGVLAIIEQNKNKLEIDYSEDLILVLDGIQDPGNLGTIIRTLDSVRT